MNDKHHVVIVGGGFGGLYAAQSLRHPAFDVTLIDRRNFHLFQPLLYQVATGWLSPANIASTLRSVLKRQTNVSVLLDEATDINAAQRELILSAGKTTYDALIVATGSRHHYFGHDEWECVAPGLKTIEDAREMRRRIFVAFEAAEREPDPRKASELLTFVIVGGGPTGVELAGALAEIARDTLRYDFRKINPANARIILLEALDRILTPYPPELSKMGERFLAQQGVTIQTNAVVTAIDETSVTIKRGEIVERIPCRTVLWAAGVRASFLGEVLANRTGAKLDRSGRVVVEPDLTVPGHPEIFVIGDLANYSHQDGRPLPGVAPVAMQQGRYVARVLRSRIEGKPISPFRYKHSGNMVIIGRGKAVADLGRVHLTGFSAWLVWLFVHLIKLVEFQNKVLVLIQWGWYYFTRNRPARLITGDRYKT